MHLPPLQARRQGRCLPPPPRRLSRRALHQNEHLRHHPSGSPPSSLPPPRDLHFLLLLCFLSARSPLPPASEASAGFAWRGHVVEGGGCSLRRECEEGGRVRCGGRAFLLPRLQQAGRARCMGARPKGGGTKGRARLKGGGGAVSRGQNDVVEFEVVDYAFRSPQQLLVREHKRDGTVDAHASPSNDNRTSVFTFKVSPHLLLSRPCDLASRSPSSCPSLSVCWPLSRRGRRRGGGGGGIGGR